MPDRANESRRIAALDGLRGLACLMVFGVHFGQISKLGGQWGPFDLQRVLFNGNTGVAIFFTLSGFLLSLPFWEAKRDAARMPDVRRYLMRRVARVVPAYWACLTALVVANRLWLEDDAGRTIGLHYLFAFNLFSDTVFAVNSPFWTVAVEAQFYLLLPLLFVATWPLGMRATVAAMLGAAAGGYLLYFAVGEATMGAARAASAAARPMSVPPSLTYSLLAHLPHFLFGVLAAAFSDAFRRAAARAPALADAVTWGGLAAMFAVLATPLDDLLRVPWGRYNLPYVPVVIALIVLAAPRAALARAVFDGPLWRPLGKISYGVYLYHLPVQHVTARFMTKLSLSAEAQWWLFGLVSLLVTLVVAALSYALLERPLLRLAHRPRSPRSGA